MNDEIERLSRVLDDMIAGRDPALREQLTPEEIRLAQAAALLRATDDERTAPDPDFAERLGAQVAALQAGTSDTASGQVTVKPKGRSRKNLLRQTAAALAGLAIGGSAAAAVAYEQGKREGQHDEASTPLTAPMVPDDRGRWMDTGQRIAALAPGRAVRFRAGAIEGFLVNPGAGSPVYALSAACTHMGCLISWQAGTGTFLCPCHGAQYNANGSVLSGIARHPLPALRLHTTAKGQLYVWSVDEEPAITRIAPYERA